MNLNLIHLFPEGPFHLAERPSLEYIHPSPIVHSDTLASATAFALTELGILANSDEVKTWLENYVFSSTFPCFQVDSRYYYFLPVPQGCQLSSDPRLRKKVKKVQWVEASLWLKWFKNKESISIDNSILMGSFAFPKEYKKDLEDIHTYIVKEERVRVQLSRDQTSEKKSHPYAISAWEFLQKDKKRMGFYFIYSGTEKNLVLQALEVLKNSGLGSDRSVGFGHFDYESKESQPFLNDLFRQTSSSDSYITLGLYLPTREEFQTMERCAYDLLLRSGWVTLPSFLNVRRNGVYMFKEGSILKWKDSDGKPLIKGKVQDVTPPEPKSIPRIYRSGKTFHIPLAIDLN